MFPGERLFLLSAQACQPLRRGPLYIRICRGQGRAPRARQNLGRAMCPRAELTEVGMAQATTAHRDWLDEGKPEAQRGGAAGTYHLVVSTRLETARLVIRTFEARDAGPWLAMISDSEVRRFLPAGPAPTVELIQRVIGERQAMERELGHTMWAVDDKTTGMFIGQCGLRPVDE